MQVEARGIEGPVISVTVRGLEVTSRVKFGRVPKPATEVGE